MAPECISLDNQELTFQSLLSVRLQARENIKERV